MKPICVSCKLFFSPKRNGIYFEEGMPVDSSKETWQSYKLWSGDLWKCKGCNTEIVVGVGQSPIREHYQDDYAAVTARLGAVFRVDDC